MIWPPQAKPGYSPDHHHKLMLLKTTCFIHIQSQRLENKKNRHNNTHDPEARNNLFANSLVFLPDSLSSYLCALPVRM